MTNAQGQKYKGQSTGHIMYQQQKHYLAEINMLSTSVGEIQ